jgi:hypothetical protein
MKYAIAILCTAATLSFSPTVFAMDCTAKNLTTNSDGSAQMIIDCDGHNAGSGVLNPACVDKLEGPEGLGDAGIEFAYMVETMVETTGCSIDTAIKKTLADCNGTGGPHSTGAGKGGPSGSGGGVCGSSGSCGVPAFGGGTILNNSSGDPTI